MVQIQQTFLYKDHSILKPVGYSDNPFFQTLKIYDHM